MTIKNRLPAITLSFAIFVSITAGLVASASSGKQAHSPSQDLAQSKIARWVMEHTNGGQEAEFIVVMKEQADLTRAAAHRGKQEKGRYVRDTLYTKARASQASLLEWLRAQGIEHQPFYIVNAILAKGTRAAAEAIAARDDVARIDGNPVIRNPDPVSLTPEEIEAAARQSLAPQAVEPGVTFIRAPEVWSSGFTGQGIVIGGADTGVQWNHPALINKYRGWNGATASHDFNWHDSIHTGGGVCGPDSPAPCDDDDHGTHTLGTAVGSDAGNVNQIGVAPGAKFIACRNMDQGNGTPARYIECMEWFLAPYPVGGAPAQGDPTKAPDLTTNSWGCPPSEGCQPATLQQAVEAQRAAGIMFVAAAGNSGSGCSTVSDPPSFYDATYTIGAISSATGNIASFSSRGPVTADGSQRIKPDITAPGVNVRSSIRNNGYASFSGTSMATPHTAGAIALLWSARLSLRNQIAQTEDLINQAAVDVFTTSCSSSGLPNNVYGWGRLDIKAAVDLGAVSINPTSQNFTSAGGVGTVVVTAPNGFSWTSTSNATWISVISGSGIGNGSMTYSVFANNGGSSRTGTITIAGQTFTVNQDGSCSFTINPTSQSFLSSGGLGSVNVTGAAECSWTAASNDNWITITSGASGSGNGAVTFSVSPNNGAARNGALTVAGQTFNVSQAANPSGLQYYALPRPIRLLDTRPGHMACNMPGVPLNANSTFSQQARTTCDGLTIPATAQAIAGNATVVNSVSQGGYVTLYPTGALRPTVSNLNFTVNQIIPNSFTVALGNNGSFDIFTSGGTHFIVDITGYYAPPGAGGLYYHPLPQPLRLLDTRPGQQACNAPAAPLVANTPFTQQARVNCNSLIIPANATAIVGNATVVNFISNGGWITLYPSDAALPNASNLNFTANQIIPNSFTVGLGSDGAFKINSVAGAHFIVDIAGYFSPDMVDVNGAGLLFTPLPVPVRLLETRPGETGCFTPGTPLNGGATFSQQARLTCNGVTVSPNAQSVVGNATVVNFISDGGWITLHPSGAAPPLASNLNYTANQIIPNAFTVGLGNDGAFNISVSANASTHFIIDLAGYFAP
jgi:subtilisin family serine protease